MQLSALDRGLHYGDGVFETMAVCQGRVRLLARHFERLEHGALRLRIPMPEKNALQAQVMQAAQALGEGVLKLILTRGCGGRGYRPPPETQPTLLLLPYAQALPRMEDARAGITLRLCTLRLAHQPVLAGIKHLNRLEQVLARAEWDDEAIDEGLLFDVDGALIEAVASNVFLLQDGRLSTPRLDQCGVEGVMRGAVMATAKKLGLEVCEQRLELDDLLRADEVFLSNSLHVIRPVRALLGVRQWSDWPVTHRLIQAVWQSLCN